MKVGTMPRWRRLLVGTVAALAVTSGAVAVQAAPAQAASEWKSAKGSGTSNCRHRTLYFSGVAYGAGTVCWSGTKVWVYGTAGDDKGDGLGVALRVRYRIKKSGKWSGWHYRNLAVDNKANGRDVNSGWKRSRYPTKDLHFKLCTHDGGVFYSCTNGWS